MDGRRLLKSIDFLWIENQRLRQENQVLRQQLAQREDRSRQLAALQQKHQRAVEEIIPVKVQSICYPCTSGYCPCCRKHIESRAPEQPPAADLPQAQLGLHALTWAAVMRVCYRMPLRQITALYGQLGLKLCPA